MLKIAISISNPNILLALVLFAIANVIWVSWLARNHRTQWILWSYVLINFVALLCWSVSIGIDEDETELLHTSWMLTQGMTPYVDFWQHHMPLGWLLVSPLIEIAPQSPFVYVVSRLLATAMSVLIGWLAWRIARCVWKDSVSPASFLLLLLAGAGLWEFAWIRMDHAMMILVLTGLLLTLRIAEGSSYTTFFVGVVFALGLSFSPKQYPVVLLPVAVIFMDGHRHHIRRILSYGAGGLVGALPLAIFVLHHNVLSEFLFWAVQFNSSRTVVNAVFPAGLALVAGAGLWRLLEGQLDTRCIAQWAVVIGFVLATWASLFAIDRSFEYYLNYWMVLAAILGAGITLPRIPLQERGLCNVRIWAMGLVLAMLTAHNIFLGREILRPMFVEELRNMRTLLNVAGGDSVLMFNPQHPVFVPDATRLYTRWQLRFINGPGDHHIAGADGGPGLVESILKERPAIITALSQGEGRVNSLTERHGMSSPLSAGEPGLLKILESKALVDRDSALRLQSFLDENYTLLQIGKNAYFVLNERTYLIK